jgi:MFS family permease
MGSVAVVIGGCLAILLGLAAIGAAHAPATLLSGAFLMGAGTGVANPCLSTIASELAGEKRRGTVLGFTQSAGGLARTVGPVWGGFLFTRFGPGAPFFGGVVAAAFAVALGILLKRGPAASASKTDEVPPASHP